MIVVDSSVWIDYFNGVETRETALVSAGNYRALRAKGVTVRKTIDVLIATFCMENRHILLHSDRDFDPIKEHLGLETL